MWHDLRTCRVEGRGWDNQEDFYCRFPAEAKSVVRPEVWFLAENSAGMVARFVTDSREIRARWTLKDPQNLGMWHQATTGKSGVDLYVRWEGQWRWLAVGDPASCQDGVDLIKDLPCGKREYALYLPLYNGVTSVEIGVADDASFEKAPPRTRTEIRKPVVFYGSSIMQGACASRPGMAYPSQIGRMLDIETINLGFSGNGKCEHEVADLLSQLDPQVYIIDCMPNMEAIYIYERMTYLLNSLREHHQNTPVILVEHPTYQYLYLKVNDPYDGKPKNEQLQRVYKDVKKDWGDKLYYIKGDKLYGNDGESTVDGVHATDVGFSRMIKVICPVLRKALETTISM